MKEVAAAGLLGMVSAALLWTSLRPALSQPGFARPNYRGAAVPIAGVVLALAALVSEAVLAAVDSVAEVHDLEGTGDARRLVLLAVAGFALVGLLDDLAGGATDRGFRGHLRAVRRGRLTTGLLKLVAGGAVAVAVAAGRSQGSLGRLVRDAALIALAANLGNLLDRAPGRTTKTALVAFAALVLTHRSEPSLAGVAVVVGAALVLLLPELRESMMLGDAGANAVGAVLGTGVVFVCSGPTRNVVVYVLVALNLASEVVSFSRVIDRVPPLRALDRVGRRRPG